MVRCHRGAFGSVHANPRYFEMGLEHFQQAERTWPGIFERLITRRVPFGDFLSALDRRPEDLKTLLTIASASVPLGRSSSIRRPAAISSRRSSASGWWPTG